MTGGDSAPSPRARLIRHAQASWGSADYDCLSPVGHRQAQRLGQWLARETTTTYSLVIRGSMRRHAQTLDAIRDEFAAAGRPLPATRIDTGWNEFDHVPVLRTYAAAHPDDAHIALANAGELHAQRAFLRAAVEAWRAGELDDGVPETWPVFGRRIAKARACIGVGEGTVLIVTSGGAMWRCAQSALELDDKGLTELDLALRNTGISEFHCGAEPWRMLSWNEVPHLAASEHQSLHTHY